MKKITIQPLSPAYLNAIAGVQSAYSAIYPDARIVPGEVYLSPVFEHGQNIFCAINENGELIGYAPLVPVLIRDQSTRPHTLWTEIKVHPACDEPYSIKDQLLEKILSRAREVTCEYPTHPLHLTFQYFPSEKASIDYVMSKGAKHTESVFTMKRDLSREIPSCSTIDDVVIRPWRMESEAELQMYVHVRNECFPEAPVELNEWQYFMQSPEWSVGTTFAAFHRDQLIGNTAVFWDEAENQKHGQKTGYTEYIFVHPDWRGKNIARTLITRGLKYLKEHGLDEAHLEVKVQNQNALRLYQDLGFEVIRESRFYVLVL
jgi:ribosomal protein S18 acetylase RimI-like enzyme